MRLPWAETAAGTKVEQPQSKPTRATAVIRSSVCAL